MATKTINSRLQMKHDTKANWDKATTFTPLNGEVIVYTDGIGSESTPKFKVGDGSTVVTSLPFAAGGSSVSFTLPAITAGGTANVSISGVTANTIGMIGLGTAATSDQYKEVSKAQLVISGQNAGTITIKALGKAITSTDIPAVLNVIQW